VFAPDAERMLEEFRTELNSATFAARRLQLTRSQQPLPGQPARTGDELIAEYERIHAANHPVA
jgi:hypothetical protein